MSEVNYQPRVGSVCYRVFELLEARGPMVEKDLAVAVDVDVSSLRSSTNLACNSRAMMREAKGGELIYSSTRVRPNAAEAAQDAPAAPAEEPPRAAWPGLASAATATEPASSAPAESPAPATAEECADVISELTKNVGAAWGKIIDEGLAKLPQAGKQRRSFEFALWSDGRLSVELDGRAFDLDVQETRKLLDYLDRMRVEEEPARG